MKEVQGELWDFWEQGYWVCITTNGYVKHNQEAAMGRGCALEAKKKFPSLPLQLGKKIQKLGNHVHIFPEYHLLTFPTKHVWVEPSNVDLIQISAIELMYALNHTLFRGPLSLQNEFRKRVYLPRPGCGWGGLSWEKVRSVLEPILDARVIIIYK